MKINVNCISFWFDKIKETDLHGDFEDTGHFFENHFSCWCKPELVYTDPITLKQIVLHKKLDH